MVTDVEFFGDLVGRCIEAACGGPDAVEVWRRQRRTLRMLPAHLAHALFNRLLQRRLLSPSLLEVFQYSVEEVDLKGKSFVDAEWMAYFGAYRSLRVVNVADCRGINSSSLWSITGMSCLEELDLSRCTKVNDAAVRHLMYVPNLKKLSLSETAVTASGITYLASLVNLTFLDLGGLPITDTSIVSLQRLTKLEHLDLWGSKISNRGAVLLKVFSLLNFINLAWTKVTTLPYLSSLKCVNMSNCTIDSLFDDCESKVPLSRLVIAGCIIDDPQKAFSSLDMQHLHFLDTSCSSFQDFNFLNKMKELRYLDLSCSNICDARIETVAEVGSSLIHLNLSKTRVTTSGLSLLAGRVPNLNTLSLSHTYVDDFVLYYLSMMPALQDVNLSSTCIKGFVHSSEEHVTNFSLTSLQDLQQLRRLDLACTQIRDVALDPISCLRELEYLFLSSDFLSDAALHSTSGLRKLKFLSLQNAVLTDTGIFLYKPPPTLRTLDLGGCWLLTEEYLATFCKAHPRITVRHEAIKPPEERSARDDLNQNPGAIGVPNSVKGKHPLVLKQKPLIQYRDERIKYSIQELLRLQTSQVSSLSLSDAEVSLRSDLTRR